MDWKIIAFQHAEHAWITRMPFLNSWVKIVLHHAFRQIV